MTAAATILAAKRPFFCYFSLDTQRKVEFNSKKGS